MARLPTSVDYKPDPRPDKTERVPAEIGASRPDDLPAVEEFLQLLARAVRQFHTYPATSRLCTDAIAACHKALAALDGHDRLAFRLTPREVIVGETGVGAGTIVEQELVRRLHGAHIAALDIDRAASPRDLSRFCSVVAGGGDLAKTKTTLAELLAEAGVDTIVPRMAHRPEVLDIGAPRAQLCHLVEHERSRRQAAPATGPVSYLYPPDKGWVRLDPAARFDTISLVDLTLLVNNPADVAAMLLRLTDDEPAIESRDAALQQKFSDVATLFNSLEPQLARVMFAKLSRAVLELEPERRKDLLRRTILPGLLDGRADGSVLHDFPDVDLAESLCLLLDLETAAPEVLTTALNRLDLPADRRQTMVPLLEARLGGAERHKPPADGAGQEPDLDRRARRLIRVEAAAGKSFAEFSAFDLSIDGQAAAAIAGVQETIGTTDLPHVQLQLLWNLVRLEPNPGLADTFARRALPLFADLERAGRQQDVAAWVSRYRQLSEDLRPSRPDVADAVTAALATFWTPERAIALADLYGAGADGRARAAAIVNACGVAIVPALMTLLGDPATQAKARALVPLMCEHAALLAPALVAGMGDRGVAATRTIVKVLGFAGPGFESAIAGQLGHPDELTRREALRALARVGTAEAATAVAGQLRQGNGPVRGAAEEALWHFPPALAGARLRELLERRDFVLQNPDLVVRLLDRAAQAKAAGLGPVLATFAPLRYRFWNPPLVRVALKARELLRP